MLTLATGLIGGLGLLLIGMMLMTDGLKLAGGGAMRDILALWTRGRLRGLLAGFLVTGLVQSSSVVTVATIGFANAGLLSLERAIWVIFGSNVGTTMTAWIVALVGFQFDIAALALPLVGLGALLKLSGGQNRRAHLGLALVGFGLLFLGIGELKGALDSLGANFTFPAAETLGVGSIALYVLLGVLLTTVTQSSSATIVMALGAAQSDLVPFNAAAAVVIGANLGTTTTSLVAVLGATATAKRVAVSHMFFNLITAVVAVLILNPLLDLARFMIELLALTPSSALVLAVFHSVFNLLGVLLMWPLSKWLVRFLSRRFRSREEKASQPRHLDHTVLALPYLAVDALALEVSRLNGQTVQALQAGCRSDDENDAEAAIATAARGLAAAIADYAVALNRQELTPFVAAAVADLMECVQQYLLALGIAEELGRYRTPEAGFSDELQQSLESYLLAIEAHLVQQDLSRAIEHPNASSMDVVESRYRRLKLQLLDAAAHGQSRLLDLEPLLNRVNQLKRACGEMAKAGERLARVRHSLHRDAEGRVEGSEFDIEHDIPSLPADTQPPPP